LLQIDVGKNIKQNQPGNYLSS